MKVAIDLDGVLRDFDSEIRHQLMLFDILKSPSQIDESQWDLNKRYKVGINVKNFVYKKYPHVFVTALPYPSAFDFIIKLKQNHKVGVITSQPTDISWQFSVEWLVRNKFLYYIDFLIRVKDSSEKQDNDFDILLDDKAKTVEECISKNKSAFLLDRDWNKQFDLPRVKNYDEFLNIVANF